MWLPRRDPWWRAPRRGGIGVGTPGCDCGSGPTFCAANPSHDLYLGADPTLVTFDIQWSGWPDGTGACDDMSELNSSNTITHSSTSLGVVAYSFVGDRTFPKCATMLLQIATIAPFFSVTGCAHGRAQSDICGVLSVNLGCGGGLWWRGRYHYSTTSGAWEFCVFSTKACQAGDPTPTVTSFTKNLNQ